MSPQRSTAGPGPTAFVLPLGSEGEAIGGKARSLARLRDLGLPVPSGFAVGPALFRALRAGGPPLPARLQSVADLAALDDARAALAVAAVPAGFEDELAAALDGASEASSNLASSDRGGAATWAVRSSAPTEDRAGAAAPGIYASTLRVPRDGITEAVRGVLASFLTPAAWMYSTREPVPQDPSSRAVGGDGAAAVLVHAFVDGDSLGSAAIDPARTATRSDGSTASDRDRVQAGVAGVHVDVRSGDPTAAARAGIEAAARTAAQRYGAVELEWVARGDQVVFLQLRGYQPARGPRRSPPAGTDDHGIATDGGWSWDAVHNPLPLSPAATGLVELVDTRCRIGIRQRVVGGYLFYRNADGAKAVDPGGVGPRAFFEALRAAVEPRLASLGDEPSLAAALELFIWAYQPLFGNVGPACVAARRALTDFLSQRRPPDRARGAPGSVAGLMAELLGVVPSAATERRAAADAIGAASGVLARQAAIDAYLRRFGDESPTWDVAAPTLRETPERLLLLGAARSASASVPTPTGEPGIDLQAARVPTGARTELERTLTPTERRRLEALIASAREAVAVGEDDDALFARLQASVRRALLGLGRHLVAAGRLDDVNDVFYLPLTLSRALEGSPAAPANAAPTARGMIDGEAASDLRAIVAAAREDLRAAALSPPAPPWPDHGAAHLVRGLAGAGGRAVGRAVHHPPSVPLATDSVLIAATLLPTELPLLDPAAIVVETGDVLGHVAAQARERGIPAIVGAPGARAIIPEGALVLVDGDRGEVLRLADPVVLRDRNPGE